jgi:hypothetical protein
LKLFETKSRNNKRILWPKSLELDSASESLEELQSFIGIEPKFKTKKAAFHQVDVALEIIYS